MRFIKQKSSIIKNFLLLSLFLIAATFISACTAQEPHNHDYKNIVISPTCETLGYEGQKCDSCDSMIVSKTIDKLSHSYEEYVKSPTCEDDGYVAKICSNCGDRDILNTLEKTGHDYVIQDLIINHAVIDNCGEFKCSICEDIRYNTITSADIKMPILSFTGSMDGISKDNKITIKTKYESEEISFESDATLKWQGATSLNYPKKNFNIQFLKTGTTSKNKVVICDDWGKQSKYTLKANWIDYSQSRNVVSGQIYGQIVKSRGVDDDISNTSNGGAVDGFPIAIYHNGNFYGLYTLNIPKDDWMWGMSDDEEDDEEITKHATLSTGNWSDDSALRKEIEGYSGAVELEYCSTEDTIGDEWVLDSFNDMIRFVNGTTDDEFKAGISNYVDLDRTIDSIIYTSLILAADNVSKNILWLTYDGQHWFSNMYDMDGTWGLVWSGNQYYKPNDSIVSENYSTNNNLWKRIYKLYKSEIAKRYLNLRMNVLSLENIVAKFTEFDNQISDLVRDIEKKKWEEVPSQDTNNIEQIINFASQRLEYMDKLMLSYLN